MLDWCQGTHDRNSPVLHEGRLGLQPRPEGLLRLSLSRPKPALCGGLISHWDASPQDVPGRPRRRALTTAPRMLNRVVFVKSLEVVPFSCFLPTPERRMRSCCSNLHQQHAPSTAVGGWTMQGGPTGGQPFREASSGGTTTPAGPPGWLAQCRDARSQVRDIPDSVSFRPVERVRTALLDTWVRVSREVSKSSQIVSDGIVGSRQIAESRSFLFS